MPFLSSLYGSSLALLTDLYQLTMAYSYWATGCREREAVYHLFFRNAPFGGDIAVAAGLETAVEFIERLRYSTDDLDYLATLTGADGSALFSRGFLSYLGRMEFDCNVDAVPEGTAVFAGEPLMRVSGPIIQCQLLETTLLNILNFQTLIASKSARVRQAAGDDTVLEFGLRRAQGVDGGISASRAAFVGGADATSNVLAGKLFGIPVRGTHAHSWVMAFDSEVEAFDVYAEAMPHNAIFLVDTYDTLQGVQRAIEAGRALRRRGFEMGGIRLDSGDLGELAREARRLLDAAGFENARIVGSGDLDEFRIAAYKRAGAPITVWGVGTKLVTGDRDSSVNGVYKLAAVRDPGQAWQYRMKLSATPGKMTTPGILQVRRHAQAGVPVADEIFDQGTVGAEHRRFKLDGADAAAEALPAADGHQDLLVPVFRNGERVYEPPELTRVREYAVAQFRLFAGVDTAHYPVGLEARLDQARERLIASAGA